MVRKIYTHKDCALYNLHNKRKLAEILIVSPQSLRRFSREDESLYTSFNKEKKSGGVREISAPIQPLKDVQARISELLSRIAPPDYLFAPVKGRSYVSNAVMHKGARSVHLLDIEDFFPSCTYNKVVWFFRTYMRCSSDIAHMLSGIVCSKGSLPQGSPCSPILAFLAYIDMWSEIEMVVKAKRCKLSVYADDLTISGQNVPKKVIWEVKSILKRHGHKVQETKERARRDAPAEITGVILRGDKICPPNRQRLRMIEVRRELKNAKTIEEKKRLTACLNGRIAQLNQIQKMSR